jgi:RimJ/RimL family protein N-acetyltransferase
MRTVRPLDIAMADPVHIREATAADARAVISLLERLYSETDFLLYEPGELKHDVEQYARRMEEAARKGTWVMFIATHHHGMVGLIFGNCGTAKRTRHSLLIGLGVVQASWNQGIGRSLLRAIESWARMRGLHRLELTVQTNNRAAIALYEKVGFEHEGTKRHSQRVEGIYVDELLMSKLITV